MGASLRQETKRKSPAWFGSVMNNHDSSTGHTTGLLDLCVCAQKATGPLSCSNPPSVRLLVGVGVGWGVRGIGRGGGGLHKSGIHFFSSAADEGEERHANEDSSLQRLRRTWGSECPCVSLALSRRKIKHWGINTGFLFIPTVWGRKYIKSTSVSLLETGGEQSVIFISNLLF